MSSDFIKDQLSLQTSGTLMNVIFLHFSQREVEIM